MLLTADADVTTDLTGTETEIVDAASATIAACGSLSFLYAVAASAAEATDAITDVDATVVSGSSSYSSSAAVSATMDVDAN